MTFFDRMTFKGRKSAPKSSDFRRFMTLVRSMRDFFVRISDLKGYFDSKKNLLAFKRNLQTCMVYNTVTSQCSGSTS